MTSAGRSRRVLLVMVCLWPTLYRGGCVTAGQTCDKLLTGKGGDGKFPGADISDLIVADNRARIKTCLAELGKDPLDTRVAEQLWKDLVKVYRKADEIPEDELQSLGWIAKGIPPRDFANLSLTDIDTIAAFGQWRNFSREQLTSLKQAVEYQWSYKEPSDFSNFDLAAFGQILCVFNTTQIAAIKPLAFKAAAMDMSNLINCPEEIIKEFATLATSKDAFGNPSEWTAIQITLIGCIISGLDSIRDIQPEAFKGLSAANMRCLPSTTLQGMSVEQLSHLSLSAVNAMSYAQRSALDREQTAAVQGTGRTSGAVLIGGGRRSRVTTTLSALVAWSAFNGAR